MARSKDIHIPPTLALWKKPQVYESSSTQEVSSYLGDVDIKLHRGNVKMQSVEDGERPQLTTTALFRSRSPERAKKKAERIQHKLMATDTSGNTVTVHQKNGLAAIIRGLHPAQFVDVDITLPSLSRRIPNKTDITVDTSEGNIDIARVRARAFKLRASTIRTSDTEGSIIARSKDSTKPPKNSSKSQLSFTRHTGPLKAQIRDGLILFTQIKGPHITAKSTDGDIEAHSVTADVIDFRTKTGDQWIHGAAGSIRLSALTGYISADKFKGSGRVRTLTGKILFDNATFTKRTTFTTGRLWGGVEVFEKQPFFRLIPIPKKIFTYTILPE
jgi:hypothetical protein